MIILSAMTNPTKKITNYIINNPNKWVEDRFYGTSIWTNPRRTLVAQLQKLGYAYTIIDGGEGIIGQPQGQLENTTRQRWGGRANAQLTDTEFEKQRYWTCWTRATVFAAKTLRQKQHLVRDNGENLYLNCCRGTGCQNQYQSHQVKQEGSYKNRYDVTIPSMGYRWCR